VVETKSHSRSTPPKRGFTGRILVFGLPQAAIWSPDNGLVAASPENPCLAASSLTRRNDWPGRHPGKPRSDRYVNRTRRNRIGIDEIPTKSAINLSESLFTASESESIAASGRSLPRLSNRVHRRFTRTPGSHLPTGACSRPPGYHALRL
jgi:hypothetical protein